MKHIWETAGLTVPLTFYNYKLEAGEWGWSGWSIVP